MNSGPFLAHPLLLTGQDPPELCSPLPGPRSRELLRRQGLSAAPMGPSSSPPQGAGRPALVMAAGRGSNVIDSDGNRYVDLAAGFGALLLGHCHSAVTSAVQTQSNVLFQALGDVYPSELKIELLDRVAALYPGNARVILCQSGADAVSAALKSAVLATGRSGVLAFGAAYHGLSYGPLAACGLRAGYREPFREQLSPHVRFVDYPATDEQLQPVIDAARRELSRGDIGAILVEPVLGRGGVVVPPQSFLPSLARLSQETHALLIADEIWTGLGRAGSLLFSLEHTLPDLICLGKGLGGGTPVSAVVGRADVLSAWQREPEVVHTSTFAGAPLACAAALATLKVLEEEQLIEQAREVGARLREHLERRLTSVAPSVSVRGVGLMLGIDLGTDAGRGSALQAKLLERGYLTTTGGGRREVLVLTPALNISEALLEGFVEALAASLRELA